jgi:hypothetical protein
MNKLFISSDERWPFFTLDDPELWAANEIPPVELSDADYADYKRVMAEFEAWQDRIEVMDRSSA